MSPCPSARRPPVTVAWSCTVCARRDRRHDRVRPRCGSSVAVARADLRHRQRLTVTRRTAVRAVTRVRRLERKFPTRSGQRERRPVRDTDRPVERADVAPPVTGAGAVGEPCERDRARRRCRRLPCTRRLVVHRRARRHRRHHVVRTVCGSRSPCARRDRVHRQRLTRAGRTVVGVVTRIRRLERETPARWASA